MDTIAEQSVGDLLQRLSAKTPAPGGGAAAGLAGATAAALGSMVVAYSIGRKDLAAHEGELREAETALRNARELCLELADRDAEAYTTLSELMKRAESDPLRREAWAGAVATAIAVPRTLLGVCVEMLRRLESMATRTNPRLRSDLASAAALAEAGARAAAWNIAANLPLLGDAAAREARRAEADSLVREAAQIARRVERACA